MLQSFLKDPSKLSSYSFKQLKELSIQLRRFLYEQSQENNSIIHRSSLDIVEVVLALFKVFDASKDHILFDNDQHQILYDLINKKESSNNHSLSSALGYALASSVTNTHSYVVCILNEQSLIRGEVYDALSKIGASQKNIVLIYVDSLTDKHKQINVVSASFSKMRTSKPYISVKSDIKSVLSYSKLGTNLLKGLSSVKETLKDVITKPSIFDELNIETLGPVDSKDLKMLVGALTLAKNQQAPMVIHTIVKRKNKEELARELDRKELNDVHQKVINVYQMLDEILYPIVKENERIVVLADEAFSFGNVATYLKKHSNRYITNDQSNGFAITLAASFAQENLKPIVIVDASIIEKASYNLHHDFMFANQNITLLITNAGLSRKNQRSNFNVFDIGVLMSASDIIIAQPKDEKEAQHLLYTAIHHDGAFAIRFSDYTSSFTNLDLLSALPIGYWTLEYSQPLIKGIVICYGEMVSTLVMRAKSNELPIMVINARFINPIDTQLLMTLANKNLPIIVYESDDKTGGLYQHIAEFFSKNNTNVSLTRLGLNQPYKRADSAIQLKKVNKIDTNSLIEYIMEVIHE